MIKLYDESQFAPVPLAALRELHELILDDCNTIDIRQNGNGFSIAVGTYACYVPTIYTAISVLYVIQSTINHMKARIEFVKGAHNENQQIQNQ